MKGMLNGITAGQTAVSILVVERPFFKNVNGWNVRQPDIRGNDSEGPFLALSNHPSRQLLLA